MLHSNTFVELNTPLEYYFQWRNKNVFEFGQVPKPLGLTINVFTILYAVPQSSSFYNVVDI